MLLSIISIAYLCICTGLASTRSISNARRRISLDMSAYTVIGASGGIAESVYSKLIDQGLAANVILTSKPYSPSLIDKNSIYIGNFEKNTVSKGSQIMSIDKLLEGSVVIVSDDSGDERLVGKIEKDGTNEAEKAINKVISILPKNVKSVICAHKASDGSNKFNLFRSNPSAAYKTWCQQNNIPFLSLQYGQLIGGIVGCEPTPFLSMPLAEPEIDPSFVLRSTVLNDVKDNKFASIELCTRESLSQAIVQALSQNILSTTSASTSSPAAAVVEALVISIVGSPLGPAEWKQVFNRISNKDDAEVSY